MPSRVIRGEINSSESLSRVSLEADLTFRALVVVVDDFGRFDARPAILKAALFPLREEVEPQHILESIEQLQRVGCVRVYEVDGRPYLQLTGWEKHRGKSRRALSSRFPDHPGRSEDSREIRPGLGGGGGGGSERGSTRGSVAASPTPAPDSKSKARKPRRKPPTPETPCPEELTPEQWGDIRSWRDRNHPEIDYSMLHREWEKHSAYWRTAEKRRRNWVASFEKWLLKALEIQRSDPRAERSQPPIVQTSREPPPTRPTEAEMTALEEDLDGLREGTRLGPRKKRKPQEET